MEQSHSEAADIRWIYHEILLPYDEMFIIAHGGGNPRTSDTCSAIDS
jgi:hypothetical protein